MVVESYSDILDSIDSACLGTLFSSPSNGISSWDEGGGTVHHPRVFLRKNAESIENKRVEFLVSAKE
jgi:hypothetical protein